MTPNAMINAMVRAKPVMRDSAVPTAIKSVLFARPFGAVEASDVSAGESVMRLRSVFYEP